MQQQQQKLFEWPSVWRWRQYVGKGAGSNPACDHVTEVHPSGGREQGKLFFCYTVLKMLLKSVIIVNCLFFAPSFLNFCFRYLKKNSGGMVVQWLAVVSSQPEGHGFLCACVHVREWMVESPSTWDEVANCPGCLCLHPADPAIMLVMKMDGWSYEKLDLWMQSVKMFSTGG